MLREQVREAPGEGLRTEIKEQPVSGADLARGMAFLRASNMQVMRLQLAVERHDRTGALEAMDELVGLDRELGKFIGAMPDTSLDAVNDALDAQKRDVLAERMVLARGKAGPDLAIVRGEPEVVTDAVEPEPETAREWTPEAYGGEWEDEPRRRWPWILLALVIAAAAVSYVLFGDLLAADPARRIMEAWT